jgi:hypothetical protein
MFFGVNDLNEQTTLSNQNRGDKLMTKAHQAMTDNPTTP